jgi:hypothetical protein
MSTYKDSVTTLSYNNAYGPDGVYIADVMYNHSSLYSYRSENIKGWKDKMSNHDGVQTSLAGVLITDRWHNTGNLAWDFTWDPSEHFTYDLTGKAIHADTLEGFCYEPYEAFAEFNSFKLLARGKFTNDFESFMGTVFLVELRKTLKLLRNPFSAILALTTAVKHNLKHAPKEAAGLILEYRLAVIPLLLDIEGITSIIKSYTDELEYKYLKKTSPELNTARSFTYGPFYIRPHPDCPYQLEISYDVTVKQSLNMFAGAFGQVVHKAPNDATSKNTRDLADRLGIHTDLAGIAGDLWELTLFSWVVDYFIPVGDLLASTRYNEGNFSYTYSGYKFVNTVKYTQRTALYKPGRPREVPSGNEPSGLIVGRNVERQPSLLGEQELTKNVFMFPSLLHVENLIALFLRLV